MAVKQKFNLHVRWTTSPLMHELFRNRAEAMREIKRREWEFDKEPTLTGAVMLRATRERVSNLEAEIAEIAAESFQHAESA